MTSRLTSRWARAPLLAMLCLLPLLALPVASAGEEDETPSGHLRTALIEVGALTDGVPGWLRARGPSLRRGDSDEEAPLFGYEREDPRYPMGQVGDLIDVLKRGVSQSSWETIEGADIVEAGANRILVRAPRELILETQRYLLEQEARLLKPLTIELQARRATGRESAAAVAIHTGNLSNEAWSEILGQTTLVRAATVTALDGQAATVRAGSQRAWLASYKGVNRETPLAADPEIRVANLGLCASVTAKRIGGGHTRLSLDCVLAEWSDARRAKLEADLAVETPRFTRVTANSEYLLRNGAWHVIQAPSTDTDILLLARVQEGLDVTRVESERPRFQGALFLPSAPDVGPSDMTLSQYDCGGLESDRISSHGPERRLHLSHYRPPEPSELEDPYPLFPTENFPDLIMSLWRSEDWEEPATIEVRGDQLYVRNTAAIQRHIGELVQSLRTRLVPSIALDVQMIEGSLELLDTLGLDTVGRGTLDSSKQEVLRAAIASGDVLHLGRQRLRSRNSLSAESSGSERHYVADYRVAREKSGATSATSIAGELFTGMQVEARCIAALDGHGVRVDLDVWRSREAEGASRIVTTPHGTLELPEMDVTRLQGSAKVLLGHTHVVGGAVSGDRLQLVLVSAHWE